MLEVEFNDYNGRTERFQEVATDWCDPKKSSSALYRFADGNPCDARMLLVEIRREIERCSKSKHKDTDGPKLQEFEAFVAKLIGDAEDAVRTQARHKRVRERLLGVAIAAKECGATREDVLKWVKEAFTKMEPPSALDVEKAAQQPPLAQQKAA